MKRLREHELFQHLSGFLKDKGIEIKEGSYARGIQRGCGLLTDAINLGQKGIGRAKVEIDKTLGQMRQTIHEKTAPRAARPAARPARKRPAASRRPAGKPRSR